VRLGRSRGGARTSGAAGTGVLADDERPTPLTRERVAQVLDSRKEHYGIDEDGDLAATYNGNEVWFLLLGDREGALQVRSRWQRRYTSEMARELVRVTNDWNRDHLWPKAYLHPEGDLVRVYAETSTNLDDGVTTKQLEALVGVALDATMAMFATLEGLLPEGREM